MNITRAQSLMLTVASLVLFFAIGIGLSLRGKSSVVQSVRDVHLEMGTDGQGSRLVLNDFQRSETRNGVKAWEVKGKTGEYYPESSKAKISQADLWLYRPDGETVHLLADQGTIQLAAAALKSADLQGNVRVYIEKKGVVITTDHAIYDKDQDLVRAPGRVTMTSPMFDLSGTSLIAHVTNQDLLIEQDVQSVVKNTKERK